MIDYLLHDRSLKFFQKSIFGPKLLEIIFLLKWNSNVDLEHIVDIFLLTRCQKDMILFKNFNQNRIYVLRERWAVKEFRLVQSYEISVFFCQNWIPLNFENTVYHVLFCQHPYYIESTRPRVKKGRGVWLRTVLTSQFSRFKKHFQRALLLPFNRW